MSLYDGVAGGIDLRAWLWWCPPLDGFAHPPPFLLVAFAGLGVPAAAEAFAGLGLCVPCVFCAWKLVFLLSAAFAGPVGDVASFPLLLLLFFGAGPLLLKRPLG